MYSRQLTGLAPNVQVVQSFSTSHGPFAFALCSNIFSEHANRSLSRSFLSIFADTAIIAIGGYAEIGSVSWSITRLAHAQWC